MARYSGPVCRLCRREGEKLFLKGDKCRSSKCAFDSRVKRAAYYAKPKAQRTAAAAEAAAAEAAANTENAQPAENRNFRGPRTPIFRVSPPGQHGAGRKKATEYSLQLREKQKCKRTYGLMEKQFHGYYLKADTMRGVTGENMLSLLERRLDNVVFRMGLGVSRAQSRQMVNHAIITVNGSVLNIPSYLVKIGDVISVKASKVENSKKKEGGLFVDYSIPAGAPAWMELAASEGTLVTAKIVSLPTREQCEQNIKEHLIIELYSK